MWPLKYFFLKYGKKTYATQIINTWSYLCQGNVSSQTNCSTWLIAPTWSYTICRSCWLPKIKYPFPPWYVHGQKMRRTAKYWFCPLVMFWTVLKWQKNSKNILGKVLSYNLRRFFNLKLAFVSKNLKTDPSERWNLFFFKWVIYSKVWKNLEF